jgi:hypothetical protein
MAKQQKKKVSVPDAKLVAAVEPVVVNGTALAVPVSAAPSTRISLEFGIDNLVAVGVVHAENRLTPKLEQQVAEIHRLGNEVNTRGAELVEIYSKTETDPEFEADCNTLIAAAEKLGIRLSVELVKGNFNPNTLKYNVTARFRGDMGVVREYAIEDDRAHEVRDEIEVLRVKQTEQSKAAARTKSQLNPGWLEKQMRASIAENAMHQTESGADTLKACLAYIDRAIDGTAPVAHRQLERD